MGLLRSLFCMGDAGPPPVRVGEVTMTAALSGLRFFGGAICELTLAKRDSESPFLLPLCWSVVAFGGGGCCSSSSSSSSLETAGVAGISSEGRSDVC